MNEDVKSSAAAPERRDTAKAESFEIAAPALQGTVKAERFETLCEIGRGGSSVVYLVKDTHDGKLYAMKLLHKDMTALNKDVTGAETEILAKLGKEGGGIPAFYGALSGDGPDGSGSSCGSDSPTTGFLMEYIEGDSLQKLLEGGRTFTVRETAEAGLSFCTILGKLHGSDPPLIYRDFKPANILVRKDGSYVLIDYGACRTFKTGAVRDTQMLGTEGYAAPEQYGGWEQSDVRTDIYGIGVVLHHMLTGRHPLESGLAPVAELMQSPDKQQGRMNSPLERGLYREMDKVLRRCCSVSPDMRFSLPICAFPPVPDWRKRSEEFWRPVKRQRKPRSGQERSRMLCGNRCGKGFWPSRRVRLLSCLDPACSASRQPAPAWRAITCSFGREKPCRRPTPKKSATCRQSVCGRQMRRHILLF